MFFGCPEKRGISGIKTDFKSNRGTKGHGKFGNFFEGLDEHRADGQKTKKYSQFKAFEEIFCNFDLQTEWAAFPNTVMIMSIGNCQFGKNKRKDYADRQREKQCFFFGAQFHTDIVAILKALDKRLSRIQNLLCAVAQSLPLLSYQILILGGFVLDRPFYTLYYNSLNKE
jgi:hypothetical protein